MTLVTLGSPGLRAGKSPAFLVLRGLAPVRAVAGEGAGSADLEWERGEREISLLRGKAATVSVAAARACGKLIVSGGMPAAAAPIPVILQIAW